jgi:hypothetical protein
MKKLLVLSLLAAMVCGVLAAPAQAYYGGYGGHDFGRHDRFERDRDHWRSDRFRDRGGWGYGMNQQQYLQNEWRMQHPFLSIFS